MAGFDDITKKAQEFLKDGKVQAALKSDQVKDAVKSDKAEEISDSILDSVAGAADKLTGGKFHDKIEEAKAQADKKIGNE
ncbi:Rv0909 family putative TA system antitoxin [Frondihabitans cladoniiphilus]|uniref:Antitoxin protein of toxin-antitoxin system n=1 Tax=Frondihabitans cladoniiphilus TaxID=715785 RepID=A0ABP8VVQ9_9MICO